MARKGPPAGREYSLNWFAHGARAIWEQMIPLIDPTRVLEVGSFEGASACFLIDTLARRHRLELHCVDHWQGGVEHADSDMAAVEARFHRNTALAITEAAHPVDLVVHKGRSDTGLIGLLAAGNGDKFDFVYIDGSHQAPDVLADAVLGFRLLRPGGVMGFDDYIWAEDLPGGRDPLRCPKPAIDAFVNIHIRQLDIVPAPIGQFYIRKHAT